LTAKGHSLGLVSKKTFKEYEKKENTYQDFLKEIKSIKTEQNNKPTTGNDLLKRTDLDPLEVKKILNIPEDNKEFFERAANEIKYSGYIAKQKREVESSKKNERVAIPSELDYSYIKGLSNEVIERLNKHKPSTLGQASRLEGVTPAATNLIAITIKKSKQLEKA
jgi:tRNA uridine 5-carboxymethylaminomethyl modification enzyme